MEILHKWTVGPVALNKLKLGYSLKLSITGAAFVLIGGFITVGGANKAKAPNKKSVRENFSFEVLQEVGMRIERAKSTTNKSIRPEAAEVGKVVRTKRKSVSTTAKIDVKEENSRVCIQNDVVRYSASQINFDEEYKQSENVVGERRFAGNTILETFWETSDEELDVGDDAKSLNIKRYLAVTSTNDSIQTNSRKRRVGVDESAKAAIMTQARVANQEVCVRDVNSMAAVDRNRIPKNESVCNIEMNDRQGNGSKTDQPCESSSRNSGDRRTEQTQNYINILDNPVQEIKEEPRFLPSQSQSQTRPAYHSAEKPGVSFDAHVLVTKM
ncbi:hypothetical protein ElyMa_001680100 [Elysia marginata]|uniref:Uncharacterized protein n=1 Tax=Elysia marginata TaxID=1093978 RepID=A0AAV4JUF5_9GAST|nr:hypothetical protein ElyMa_001680100 [Elysia marginata]